MADNPNEEFWDKVGEDTDPVQHFIKQLTKCGATVNIEGSTVQVRNACSNLRYHESGNYKELFCDECNSSVSIDRLVNLDADLEKEDEEDEEDEVAKQKSASKELNDLDDFMSAVESGVGDHSYDDSFEELELDDDIVEAPDSPILYEEGDDWPIVH